MRIRKNQAIGLLDTDLVAVANSAEDVLDKVLSELDLDESRRAVERARDELRDLDIEADDLARVARVGLDERRAALGVTAPAKFR